MKVFDKLILVSRSSILSKRFGTDEKQLRETLSGTELDTALASLPTEDEKEFMEIFQSSIPQLARLQRKMSVCLDAEVSVLTDDQVSYEYSGKTYEISAPKNAYRICVALDRSAADGFAELCDQGCVRVGGVAVTDVRRSTMAVDELKLLMKIAGKFFFQTYMD